jgi:hypothetical protein
MRQAVQKAANASYPSTNGGVPWPVGQTLGTVEKRWSVAPAFGLECSLKQSEGFSFFAVYHAFHFLVIAPKDHLKEFCAGFPTGFSLQAMATR